MSNGPGEASDLQPADDPYARVAYRRLIAWRRRIEREGPLLERLLEQAPDRSVVDLGCGPGEHVAWFAGQGVRAVGLDRSESMIAAAKEHEADGLGHFHVADLTLPPDERGDELAELDPFGLALCLGNVLPHFMDADELDRFLTTARDLLVPGGLLLIQILNYERLRLGNVRTLKVNVRPDPEGATGDEEIVFLRVLRPLGEGRWQFFPTTLRLDPHAEEPMAVHGSRAIEVRGWESEELRERLEASGFAAEILGDVHANPFDPMRSPDVVAVARRV